MAYIPPVATGGNAEALPGTTRSYNLRASSGPAVPLRHYNSATSMEYGLLKPPYEMLNRRLRTAIKKIGKLQFQTQSAGNDFKKALPKADATVPVSSVERSLTDFTYSFDNFVNAFDDTTADELECAKRLELRTQYLYKGMHGNDQDKDFYRRQRIHRLIIEHLLRVGYFETAQKLSDHVGVDAVTNQEIFQVAKQVEESLRAKELNTCLQWISDNRSKLHRLQSTFEKEIHVQFALELAKVGKRLEALDYVKKNLSSQHETDWDGNAMTLLVTVGAGAWFPGDRYTRLVSEDRWQELIRMFRMENARIFNISALSPFSAALQLGICAHKTSHCMDNSKSKCIVCRELFEFANGLPYSHCAVSKLICPHRNEPIDEVNVPMMLPNGQVYGINAINELTNSEKQIRDPASNQVFDIADVKRLYVL
uniref:E3 ubiquitin-protein transferase MAEA n=1 Tax=Panagrellus redivivus TaxID=6233 RepID=A0A7E4V9Y2_PANRE